MREGELKFWLAIARHEDRLNKLEATANIEFLQRIRALEVKLELDDYAAGYKRGYEDGRKGLEPRG